MLRKLVLRNFRNHRKLDLDITHPLLVITGQNGSGKTNILESIYVSSFQKSFRSRNTNLITSGSDFFTIDRYEDDTHIHSRFIQTPLSYRKSLKINNTLQPLKVVIGKYPIVLFDPSMMDLLTGLPIKRRQYLDVILSQIDPLYLYNLLQYTKLLRQRNSLLRQLKDNKSTTLLDQLFIYNIQIIPPAWFITQKRKAFLKNIQNTLIDQYHTFSIKDQDISLDYNASITSKEDFLDQLQGNQDKDILLQRTLSGPHRDDFQIVFQGQPISSRASRGEVRSITLTLKLIELDYVSKHSSNPPILLLDDVLSELDTHRQDQLLDRVKNQQTIITTTSLQRNINPKHQLLELQL